MPFARPAGSSPYRGPSPSPTTGTESGQNSSSSAVLASPDSSLPRLATPYDPVKHGEQLEAMRLEAASSLSDSSSHSPSPSTAYRPSYLSNTFSFSSSTSGSVKSVGSPPPALMLSSSPPHVMDLSTGRSAAASTSHSSSSSSARRTGGSMNGGSSSAAGGKAMTAKQKLFQMSDDELEPEDNGSKGKGQQQEGQSEPAQEEQKLLTRMRPNRSDPIRSSISALSGVTIIGKGRDRNSSISSHASNGSATTIQPSDHGRQGSISSIGSTSSTGNRRSIDEVQDRRKGSLDGIAESSTPTPPNADPPFAPKTGDAMNLKAALALLHAYPPQSEKSAEASTANASRETRAKPPLPRSVSAFTGTPSSSSFAPTPISTSPIPQHRNIPSAVPPQSPSVSTAPRRPRVHSRGAMGLDSSFVMSPTVVSAELKTVSPETTPLVLQTSPVMASAPRRSPRASRPPSFSNFSWEPMASGASSSSTSSSRPRPSLSRSNSRRGSKATEGMEGEPSSARSTSTYRTESGVDLQQIMRSFSSRQRISRSPSVADAMSPSSSTASLADDPTIQPSNSHLRRSTRSNHGISQTSTDLKSLIQQKRRQASAPFNRSVNIPSGTSSAAHSPVLGSGARSPVLAPNEQFQHSTSAFSAVSPRLPWEVTPPRRARSRHGTSQGFGASWGTLSMSGSRSAGDGPLSAPASNEGPATAHSAGFEEARLLALRGMGEVVMTPSLEEWRQLGLHESLNDKSDESSGSTSSESSDDEGSDDDDAVGESDSEIERERRRNVTGVHLPPPEETPRARLGSIKSINQYYGSLPPPEFSPSDMKANAVTDSKTPTSSKHKQRFINELNQSDISSSSEADDSSVLDREFDPDARMGPRYNRENSESPPLSRTAAGGFGIMPTLSRQSLSAPTGSPLPGFTSPATSPAPTATAAHPSGPVQSHDYLAAPSVSNSSSVTSSGVSTVAASPVPMPIARSGSPLPLAYSGPVDPRYYSAVTGLRNVNSFVVVAEAGKGAYGLVRKVREKGPDGRPIGPDLMLKYIVKQRILADAWKRHKVLGAIPMEIHVLDHIRRVYRPFHNGMHSPESLRGGSAAMRFASPPLSASSGQFENSEQLTVGHPNLCGMLDFFEDAENYYLVMPCFGSGQDLFDYVDMAPNGLDIGQARSIFAQIVDGVQFLHSHGIVHRDIKDENVILDGNGAVQLIDFGSAAYIKEGKPYFDTFSGTLDFASPEVLRGERYGGKETDIWAFGVLAYVILCGECPFWTSEEAMAGLAPGTRAEAALASKVDSIDVDDEDAPITYQATEAAIDFVHQCLQTHSRDRPSALHLRQHRFLANGGWTGVRGWEATSKEDGEEGSRSPIS